MIQVGVVGATGYTGLELCRLLTQHPKVNIKTLYSREQAGSPYSDIYPQFKGILDQELEEFSPHNTVAVDVLFLAIPHATSHAYMAKLKDQGIKVIDLSADFRLNSADAFSKFYEVEHQSKELLDEIPYGIPELNKAAIKNAQIVANPGCYATSVILGLYPLIMEKLCRGPIISDSKSGVSGAGKKPKQTSHFCEASESLAAYGTGQHRHSAEIDMVLGKQVFFSPHLVPMSRGILSTIYVQKVGTKEEVLAAFEKHYKNQPFVQVNQSIAMPDTKLVAGTNNCLIHIKWIEESDTLVIFSAIDNLIKGASGQAIQNMNLMLGFDETDGLNQVAMYL